MFNVLLDALPNEYNGFSIDSDFQTGIQMFQALNDSELSKQERIGTALSLLFLDSDENGNPLPRPDIQTAVDGLMWFLTGWQTDRHSEKDQKKVTDYDIDQWRIYSAFRNQYKINLNTEKLHFWEFMGLLSTLDECAYTRVIGIRQQKISPKMSTEEKKALREAKKIYSLDILEEEITTEDQEAIDEFMKLVKGRG